jgi:hypothetical protein
LSIKIIDLTVKIILKMWINVVYLF